MEIVEGIHRVDEASSNIAHSNVYVVVDGKSLIVVDTGTGGNAKKMVEYIQKMGYQPADVAYIVLTHYHMDHMGSAKDLKDMLPNAKVVVHEADAPFVSGKEAYPKPKNILFRAVSSFIKPTPVPVDFAVNDGDRVGRLTVVYTPGHTVGSISLLDEERKALFPGDMLRWDGEKVTGAPRQFTFDASAEKESIRKISALNFDVMLPGHGDPLTKNASEAVKRFSVSLQTS